MRKLTWKTKTGKRHSMWMTVAELQSFIRNVDLSGLDELRIQTASVPVLPTQQEMEATGTKDQ